MKQRDICFANLNPTKGREQSGFRPVVIVSGDTMNDNLDICLVCPLSSKIKSYPASILIPKTSKNGLSQDSEAICFQIRVLAKERLMSSIGQITQEQLEDIAEAVHGLFEVS